MRERVSRIFACQGKFFIVRLGSLCHAAQHCDPPKGARQWTALHSLSASGPPFFSLRTVPLPGWCFSKGTLGDATLPLR